MTKTIVAIFNSMDDAQNAVYQLTENGFSRASVDVSSGRTYAGNHEHDHDGESGISRFFKNLFGDDDASDKYTKVAENGNIVTVHATSDEEATRASALLDDYGAVDVDENYQQYVPGNNSREDDYDTTGNIQNDESKTIPIIEEDINVGKKEVVTGGVRIRSRIIEKPVEENLRLREEHISVERNKVDRPATEAELNNLADQTIELKEHAEIADVRKTSRVVEEVSLKKEVEHRDETVSDNIRKTEVDVEDLDADNTSRIGRNI